MAEAVHNHSFMTDTVVDGCPACDKVKAISARRKALFAMGSVELVTLAKNRGVAGPLIIGASQEDLINRIIRIETEPMAGSEVDVTELRHEGSPAPIAQHLSFTGPPFATESARYIVETLLPGWIDRFLRKNADYGDQHRFGLGPQAEYVGIDRKMYKLEQALWNRAEMNHEGVEEMLDDLIGQCFLIKDLLAGNWEPRTRNPRTDVHSKE